MKSILMSIKPYYAYLIIKGEKTIEVRKFGARKLNWSGKIICYVSKDKQSFNRIPQDDRAEFAKYLGNVAFEFVKGGVMCEEALHMRHGLKDSCLTHDELDNYGKGKPLYGYRITSLKVYDKPKELGEFSKPLSEKDLEEGNYDLDCGGEVSCYDYPEGGDYCADCEYGGAKPLTRAPQSWQYVAEK